MILNNFRNKTVIVTGHTGFKGSWLSQWLVLLGANVIGVSAVKLTGTDAQVNFWYNQ